MIRASMLFLALPLGLLVELLPVAETGKVSPLTLICSERHLGTQLKASRELESLRLPSIILPTSKSISDRLGSLKAADTTSAKPFPQTLTTRRCKFYNWPFVDAIKSGAGSVMCSYQQINNSYGCANSKTLNGLLKGELGFQGFVMADWGAQHSGVSSAVAGLDMTMPGDTAFNTGASYWGGNLTLAVLNGTVPAYRLDDMVMRIMSAYFKVGRTIEGQPEINFSSWTRDTFGYSDAAVNENWEQVNSHVDVRGDHASHIRESAAKGTVLLKNTGSLPLIKPKFVAVIGEDAGPNPKGPNGCDNRGCADGTFAQGWGSGTADFPYLITPDSALQRQAIEDGSRYESVLSNYEWAKTKALITQPNATAIVFANAGAGEGFIDVDGNVGDRKNLTLWKNGDELIKNVSSLNPNTIVVLHTAGPVLVKEWLTIPTSLPLSGPVVPDRSQATLLLTSCTESSPLDALHSRGDQPGRVMAQMSFTSPTMAMAHPSKTFLRACLSTTATSTRLLPTKGMRELPFTNLASVYRGRPSNTPT
uniref:beta-glucosidase n=1 Tax=Bionectria ochroleuca TaxID=29856 RepID=A0A8H7NF67_BIOOC